AYVGRTGSRKSSEWRVVQTPRPAPSPLATHTLWCLGVASWTKRHWLRHPPAGGYGGTAFSWVAATSGDWTGVRRRLPVAKAGCRDSLGSHRIRVPRAALIGPPFPRPPRSLSAAGVARDQSPYG